MADIETELRVKVEDIIILSESLAKLAQEVYALHCEMLNQKIDAWNKRS